MSRSILIDLQYLPCLNYFSEIAACDTIYIEAQEKFQKQTYRNRCEILSSNGPISLTVPVVGETKKATIKKVEIDYTTFWQNQHWKSIQSAYGKAPFYEDYSPYIKDVIMKKPTFLFDLNLNILTICLQLLNLSPIIKFTEEYEKLVENNVIDLRSTISPKKKIINPNSLAYVQLFGSNFVANLSIIDLLFCEGPNAMSFLKR